MGPETLISCCQIKSRQMPACLDTNDHLFHTKRGEIVDAATSGVCGGGSEDGLGEAGGGRGPSGQGCTVCHPWLREAQLRARVLVVRVTCPHLARVLPLVPWDLLWGQGLSAVSSKAAAESLQPLRWLQCQAPRDPGLRGGPGGRS